MTNPKAIHTVGASLVAYLKNAFESDGKTETGIGSCDFRLLSSGEIAKLDDGDGLTLPTLSLYLFRVTMNEHLRNTRRPLGATHQDVPLPLDLHYMLTVWAERALHEHTLLAWAMRELYQRPVLDSSSLARDANWDPADVIQMIPAELSAEDMMRIWDALEPSYRLSVSYIARVVRLDAQADGRGLPVVATRFHFQEPVNP